MGVDEDPEAAKKLRGISKIFNSVTVMGKVRSVILTYSLVAGAFIYHKFKPKLDLPVKDKKEEPGFVHPYPCDCDCKK